MNSSASDRGRRSSRRGKAFERRVAKYLTRVMGFEWRRTPLSGGWTKKRQEHLGDVYPVGNPSLEKKVLVECKNRKGWTLQQLMRKTGPVGKWMRSLEEAPVERRLLFLTSPGSSFTLLGLYPVAWWDTSISSGLFVRDRWLFLDLSDELVDPIVRVFVHGENSEEEYHG